MIVKLSKYVRLLGLPSVTLLASKPWTVVAAASFRQCFAFLEERSCGLAVVRAGVRAVAVWQWKGSLLKVIKKIPVNQFGGGQIWPELKVEYHCSRVPCAYVSEAEGSWPGCCIWHPENGLAEQVVCCGFIRIFVLKTAFLLLLETRLMSV